ncbi:unnamed protein product [Rotaria magnacalcarata]
MIKMALIDLLEMILIGVIKMIRYIYMRGLMNVKGTTTPAEYNRVILENAPARTAVVNALAKFGAASEELLPNILLLLHRTTLDQDDEVRDRATFYYQLLKHSDKALNSANIFNSMNVSLSALECLLHRYTMESTTKPFDVDISIGVDPPRAYAEPSVIYDKSGITKLFKIPGIYKGCFMIESLLQSTLECFYNQTCINQLNSYLLSNSSLDVKALDSSLTSRFVEKSTMEELINKLLIEQWNLSMIHENYYNACQPISCIYSYTTRNDIIYILTIVIGLVGGIIEILKFVIPPVIQSFAQYWFKTK